MHALGASRARVLHVPRPSRRVAPLVLPTPQSRATHSPSHQNTPSSPGALQHRRQSPLAARRRPQRVSARSVPPKPLPLATCPWNSSASSSRVSSSSRRRHDALPLQGGGSPANLSNGRRKPTSSRYIRRPPNSFKHADNLRPPPWHPHSQQSSGESRLPQLRPVRPPPRPSSVHRNQNPSRPSNATK